MFSRWCGREVLIRPAGAVPCECLPPWRDRQRTHLRRDRVAALQVVAPMSTAAESFAMRIAKKLAAAAAKLASEALEKKRIQGRY